jgi:hypothetical protein
MPAEYVVRPSNPPPLLTSILLQKRHKRTFSEDERIQAQANVKKVEDEDPDDIDEPEDPVMLQREAKDWKVRYIEFTCWKLGLILL